MNKQQTTELQRGIAKKSPQENQVVLAIGNFDGVHLGHRALLSRVKELASSLPQGQAVLLSFYPHPTIALGRSAYRPALCTLKQKLSILSQLKIDKLVLLRFSKELSKLSAADFINNYLIKTLNVHTLVVGPDATFGKGREADVNKISAILNANNRHLEIVEHLNSESNKIGSRMIRTQIEDGELEQLSSLLGNHYEIQGRVVSGDGRGKKILFPTANISTKQLLPKAGVYAGELTWANHSEPAVINIGLRPTFGGKNLRVEAHLYNYNGEDFYRYKVNLKLKKRIRDERRFDGIDDLVAQIRLDIEEAKNFHATKQN